MYINCQLWARIAILTGWFSHNSFCTSQFLWRISGSFLRRRETYCTNFRIFMRFIRYVYLSQVEFLFSYLEFSFATSFSKFPPMNTGNIHLCVMNVFKKKKNWINQINRLYWRKLSRLTWVWLVKTKMPIMFTIPLVNILNMVNIMNVGVKIW